MRATSRSELVWAAKVIGDVGAVSHQRHIWHVANTPSQVVLQWIRRTVSDNGRGQSPSRQEKWCKERTERRRNGDLESATQILRSSPFYQKSVCADSGQHDRWLTHSIIAVLQFILFADWHLEACLIGRPWTVWALVRLCTVPYARRFLNFINTLVHRMFRVVIQMDSKNWIVSSVCRNVWKCILAMNPPLP